MEERPEEKKAGAAREPVGREGRNVAVGGKEAKEKGRKKTWSAKVYVR